MRTTVDIDQTLLEDAMRLSGRRTKKDVIKYSLQELVRRKHLDDLIAMGGTMDLDIDLDELLRLREHV